MSQHDARRPTKADEFDGPDLDRVTWLPSYLPAWSSAASSAATYELRDSCLRLSIPAGHGLWCAGDHTPPLRVSGIQSGNFSGPVDSTIGQQPYRDGLTVREEQETFWGWTPGPGYIEFRTRMTVTERSMAAFWMVGLEDRPERSAEICIVEVFGKTVVPGESAEVGMGLHAFRDPAVTEDFQVVRLAIDVAEFHTYAADWTPEKVEFLVDGEQVRTCPRPPTYPLQLMLAVFDFPDWSTGADRDLVPILEADYVRTYAR